jgi:hypothetical protein
MPTQPDLPLLPHAAIRVSAVMTVRIAMKMMTISMR